MSETKVIANEVVVDNIINKPTQLTALAPVSTISITGANIITSQLPRSRSGSTIHSSASGDDGGKASSPSSSSSSSVSFNDSATHSTSSVAPTVPAAARVVKKNTHSSTDLSSPLRTHKPKEIDDGDDDDDVLGYLTVSETARPPSSIIPSNMSESAVPIIVSASSGRSRRPGGGKKTSTSGSGRTNNQSSINGRIRNVFEVIRSRFNNAQTKPAGSIPDKKALESTSSLSSTASRDDNDLVASSSSKKPKKSSIKKEKSKKKSENKVKEKSSKEQIDLKPMTNSSVIHKTTQSGVTLVDHHRQCDHHHHHHQMTTLCELCYNECSLEDKRDGRLSFIYALDTCEHSFCLDCLRQYLKYQIIESRVAISCPKCSEKMHPNEIYNILSYSQYDSSERRRNSTIVASSAAAVELEGNDQAVVTTAAVDHQSQGGYESENNESDMLLKSSKFSKSSKSRGQSAQAAVAVTEDKEFNPSSSSSEYKQLIRKYEEFMVRRVLVTIADTRWCPAPDCTYAVIASGCANCPQLFCQRPGCNTSFCYHCKQYWHPNLTCEDAAIRSATGGGASGSGNQSGGGVLSAVSVANLETTLIQAAVSNTQTGAASTNKIFRSFWHRSNSHLSSSSSQLAASSSGGGPTSSTSNNNNNSTNLVMSSRSGAAALLAAAATASGDWMKEEIKRCPKCLTLIVKMDDGSCNHITCSVCGCEFCWLCMKEISDLHYLSPSGCTFWGKKPWSRKKKIMWQLGTLIGAPVGIALIAGVAVPAILIGLPIWSGRKVYVRYKTIGKHKRNLILVGTVAGTVLVAPLVAALAVGIGVPILLAYVYGVVPISLCRSGGCGVTKNNNGGVRFAFDDEVVTSSNAYSNNNHNNNGNEAKDSKTSNSGFTSVTIPISAIEPRHADKSDKTSGHQQQQQTPVLVTITMANNNSTSSSSKAVKPSQPGSSSSKNSKRHHRHQRSSSRGKHHRHEKTASSVSTSSVNNQGAAITSATTTTSSTLIEKAANVRSSASITCGLVDVEQTSSSSKLIMTTSPTAIKNRTNELDEETAASETGTAAAAILKRLTKSIHSDNLSASSLISASMQGLEDQTVKETEDDENINKKTVTSQSKQTGSPRGTGNIIVKMVSQRTTGGGVSLVANSRQPSKRVNQNPSIGEMSIGIASLSAGNSVDQVDYALENVSLVDETKGSSNTTKSTRAKTVGEVVNTNTNINSTAATNVAAASTLNDPLDRADRDSTSNKAMASINSIRVDLNECGVSECGSRLDSRRSTSCTTYNKSLLGVDLEACSASIISEKSMNPSVSALAGSIKDNQSISNYSEK